MVLRIKSLISKDVTDVTGFKRYIIMSDKQWEEIPKSKLQARESIQAPSSRVWRLGSLELRLIFRKAFGCQKLECPPGFASSKLGKQWRQPGGEVGKSYVKMLEVGTLDIFGFCAAGLWCSISSDYEQHTCIDDDVI